MLSGLPTSIQLSDGPFPVTWRRSARARRLSLRLARSGDHVIVTLPPGLPAQSGFALLAAHRDWIARQLQRRPVQLNFAAGSTIPINGVPHTIYHTPDGHGGAWIDGTLLYVSGDIDFLPRRVQDFLQRMASRQFGQRVPTLSETTRLLPTSVVIRNTLSRWGSCTTAGRIMLTWRLIMAPPFVQDYVIFHELAHLKHHNHSAAFWQLVDHICPRRAEAETWLKTHGPALMRAA
ncbi:M48 family metallopeptidase [Acetobacter conturbans]|uniref:M48 family metallopeptidase n=1 Tax=Acetobacter conturbans TaxID=1737472 RepID=UPI001F551CF8|nr:SprT family zinc-dependent metalloprotease [Acetobacter conturbans]